MYMKYLPHYHDIKSSAGLQQKDSKETRHNTPPISPNRNKFLFVKQQLVTTYLLTELVLVKTLNFQTVQPQKLISLKHHFFIFFLPVSWMQIYRS